MTLQKESLLELLNVLIGPKALKWNYKFEQKPVPTGIFIRMSLKNSVEPDMLGHTAIPIETSSTVEIKEQKS